MAGRAAMPWRSRLTAVAALGIAGSCLTGLTSAAAATSPALLAGGVGQPSLPQSCPPLRPSGWVAKENSQPGTALDVAAVSTGAVLGYLDRLSATCGEQVGVRLGQRPDALLRTVTLAAFRLGWYGSTGARLVWRSPMLTIAPQNIPSGVTAPHLVTPNWPLTTTVTVTSDWPPGMYVLVPQDALTGEPAGAGIPLVIRDDLGHEPVLMQLSTLTWNAYNDWGGWSLYHGPAGDTPAGIRDQAHVVAVHRPLVRGGYEQMAFMDVPVVRQLERLAAERGVDVAYTTDVAVDADPTQVTRHSEFVAGGHSEYWTTRMYDGLLAARAHQVNAAFLGANNLWWRTRLEHRMASGEPADMVVYRSVGADPNKAAPTIEWDAGPHKREPAAVLGQSHAEIGVRGALKVLDAPAWFLAGTTLQRGTVLLDAVGNEADGYDPQAPNPAHTQLFAAGSLDGHHGPVLTTISYTTTRTGAATFAAGNTDWACAPTGRCPDHAVPPATAAAIAAMTRNAVAALATPAAGRARPATAASTLPATWNTLLPLASGATGTYAGSTPDEPATIPHH